VQRNVIAPATLTFAGGGRTDAVGFFLRAGSNFPGGDYRFDVATASGETFTADSGIIGGFIFRGFVPSDGIDDGINSLSITPLEVQGISGFFLDDVSRAVIASAIPEPSTLVLGTTGALGSARLRVVATHAAGDFLRPHSGVDLTDMDVLPAVILCCGNIRATRSKSHNRVLKNQPRRYSRLIRRQG
jgi:hypothetical protein